MNYENRKYLQYMDYETWKCPSETWIMKNFKNIFAIHELWNVCNTWIMKIGKYLFAINLQKHDNNILWHELWKQLFAIHELWKIVIFVCNTWILKTGKYLQYMNYEKL